MDLRGITHPRHAGLPSMLPVNTGQPQLVKEHCKDNKLPAKPATMTQRQKKS